MPKLYFHVQALGEVVFGYCVLMLLYSSVNLLLRPGTELVERLGPDGHQGIAPGGAHVSIPGEERGCDYWNVDMECGMWVLECGIWNVGMGMWRYDLLLQARDNYKAIRLLTLYS